jgi:hypothetical protein
MSRASENHTPFIIGGMMRSTTRFTATPLYRRPNVIATGQCPDPIIRDFMRYRRRLENAVRKQTNAAPLGQEGPVDLAPTACSIDGNNSDFTTLVAAARRNSRNTRWTTRQPRTLANRGSVSQATQVSIATKPSEATMTDSPIDSWPLAGQMPD